MREEDRKINLNISSSEFDPYAIVVLNQLWILGYIWIEERKEEYEEDKTKEKWSTFQESSMDSKILPNKKCIWYFNFYWMNTNALKEQ